MHIFLSQRKNDFFFSPVIVESLFLEHEDGRLKEQECQVLLLVALGKIMDFSTAIICNLLLHKCKTGFQKKTATLDVQHLIKTSGFNLLQVFIVHFSSF